jgi:hypothetical protein
MMASSAHAARSSLGGLITTVRRLAPLFARYRDARNRCPPAVVRQNRIIESPIAPKRTARASI